MTRLEHFKKLPLQKRLQAMENIRKTRRYFSFYALLNMDTTLPLSGGFNFSRSRQGRKYWMNIDIKYFR